jgi:hypothetical protein
MSEKLGRLAVAHFIERKELTDALLFRGHPPQQLGPQRGVEVSFRRRGDIIYFRGVLVVQLRDHVVELDFLVDDAG